MHMMSPSSKFSVLVRSFLLLLCSSLPQDTTGFDGRNAVTQYAWTNKNCLGPISEVLATYRLNECCESVYSGVYLFVSFARANETATPDGIVYSHFTDKNCQNFSHNSTEGLLACSAGGQLPTRAKMMVYGGAGIAQYSYDNGDCSGDPSSTEHFVAYSCWNKAGGGSQMVNKDAHVHYSEYECNGAPVHTEPISIGNCSTNGSFGHGRDTPTAASTKYVFTPPGYF
eukprot:m.133085 g.133085  ORF g.133085 m.133085 type:complete len:227 (+) comp17524_c0_seq2:265-945(+)